MNGFVELAHRLREEDLSFSLGVSPDGKQAFASTRDTAVVVGPSQSGKTTGVMSPAVALHAGPVVVTSHKPDIRNTTIEIRRALAAIYGGRVYELAVDEAFPPHRRSTSMRLDLVTGAERWNTALDRAISLTHAAVSRDPRDQHWRDTAGKYLAVALFAAARQRWGMDHVFAIFNSRNTAPLERFVAGFRATGDPEMAMAMQTLGSLIGPGATSDRELASIYSTITSTVLGGFRYLTSGGDAVPFDPAAVLAGASTLYITVRDERAPSYAAAFAAHIEILTAAWRAGLRHRAAGPLLLALDEVAKVAPITSLPALITGGAGDGIQVVTAFQEPGLSKAWGTEANIVLNGPAHEIIFPGLRDDEFLASRSQLYGQRYAYDLVYETGDVEQAPGVPDAAYLLGERLRLDAAVSDGEAVTRRYRELLEANRLRVQRNLDGHIVPAHVQPDELIREVYGSTAARIHRERRSAVEVGDLSTGRGHNLVFVGSRGAFQFRRFPRLTHPLDQADPPWNQLV